MDAMSSEDSCYEDDENGSPKVSKYAVRKLPWESRAMKKIKKKLDKAYRKRLSKRAKERTVTRTEAEELSERQLQTHCLNGPLKKQKINSLCVQQDPHRQWCQLFIQF